MVKYSDEALDSVFAALSDRTRRRVLGTLSERSRQVTELAAAHDMSLPGFMKHLGVLEDAGLIARSKEGRVVSCALTAAPMKQAATWMARYEKFWSEKLDSLARYLYQQDEHSPAATASRRKRARARGPARRR